MVSATIAYNRGRTCLDAIGRFSRIRTSTRAMASLLAIARSGRLTTRTRRGRVRSMGFGNVEVRRGIAVLILAMPIRDCLFAGASPGLVRNAAAGATTAGLTTCAS